MTLSREHVYRFGPFEVDVRDALLTHNEVPIPLQLKTFEVLLVLLENHDRLVTKEMLLEAVWTGRYVNEGSLTKAIFALRKALNPYDYIVTVHGRGYKFQTNTDWEHERRAGSNYGSTSSAIHVVLEDAQNKILIATRRGPYRHHRVESIARQFGLPADYVEHLLGELRERGLVEKETVTTGAHWYITAQGCAILDAMDGDAPSGT
jgi:DNA-binding winged helix-turn-helix (wHTH) protein